MTKEEGTFQYRCALQGFDIGRGTISHIETGLRGVSDLEMVLLAKALRVKLDELVPGELPAWERLPNPATQTIMRGPRLTGLVACFATTTGTRHETDDSNFWTLRGSRYAMRRAIEHSSGRWHVLQPVAKPGTFDRCVSGR